MMRQRLSDSLAVTDCGSTNGRILRLRSDFADDIELRHPVSVDAVFVFMSIINKANAKNTPRSD